MTYSRRTTVEQADSSALLALRWFLRKLYGAWEYITWNFTLIEALILLSIVGILASIAVPAWDKYKSRAVTSGVVIERQFEPAHSTTTMMLVGKVMVPNTQHYPDRWSITIRGEGDEGEWRTRTVYVPEAEYHDLVEGSPWQE